MVLERTDAKFASTLFVDEESALQTAGNKMFGLLYPAETFTRSHMIIMRLSPTAPSRLKPRINATYGRHCSGHSIVEIRYCQGTKYILNLLTRTNARADRKPRTVSVGRRKLVCRKSSGILCYRTPWRSSGPSSHTRRQTPFDQANLRLSQAWTRPLRLVFHNPCRSMAWLSIEGYDKSVAIRL